MEKKWNDSKSHTYDAVTIYLQVTDPDGTVRRIRQIDLSDENEWKYTWTNLPMYRLDPETGKEYVPTGDEERDNAMKYQYSVVEAYEPGYQQSTTVLQSGTVTKEIWAEATSLSNGGVYILKTDSGCLSTVSANSDKLQMLNETEAKSSPLALWKVTTTISNGTTYYQFHNEATNLKLNYNYYYSGGWNRYFNVTTGGSTLRLTTQGDGMVLYSNNGYYYLDDLSNGYATTTTTKSSALVFTPLEKTTVTENNQFEGTGYRVTNTPLTSETSLKVTKRWEHPFGSDNSIYEKLQITVKLYYLDASGKWVDAGRDETLNLKSNWEATFQGLPYKDENGNVIQYKIVEVDYSDWIPVYGEVTKIGNTNTYQTTLTNHYRWTDAVELPATGGVGFPLYILIGLTLMAAPFVYGFRLRREYERRSRE